MRAIRLPLFAVLLASACAGAAPPQPNPALGPLLAERKFGPHGCYPGADSPEDGVALEGAVDGAIRDVAAMSPPVDGRAVRGRLERLIRDVDSFATKDRDAAYRYAIRIWRAAGLHEESHLFAIGDAEVLREPC